MSFSAAVSSVLSQYATFSGRARRSEFWWWTLLTSLVSGVLYVAALVLLAAGAATTDPNSTELGAGGVGALLVLAVMGLLGLALFLPSLAVLVRRLHDTGRSGWWYLVSFVPFGGIVLLVFEVMDSEPGPNRYGPDPKGIGLPGYPYGPPAGYALPVPDPRFGAPQY